MRSSPRHLPLACAHLLLLLNLYHLLARGLAACGPDTRPLSEWPHPLPGGIPNHRGWGRKYAPCPPPPRPPLVCWAVLPPPLSHKRSPAAVVVGLGCSLRRPRTSGGCQAGRLESQRWSPNRAGGGLGLGLGPHTCGAVGRQIVVSCRPRITVERGFSTVSVLSVGSGMTHRNPPGVA